MTMHKLASELDETARQTAAMLDGISAAIGLLADPAIPGEEARIRAVSMIVTALQGQDRIEQRCVNLATAIRRIAELPASAPREAYEDIWAGLTLDELRISELSGVAGRIAHGEPELF
jgi:hypothetical protein